MEEFFKKRCDRRYRTYTAVKRRIKRWLYFDIYVDRETKIKSNAEKERFVFDGKGFQFLRTTSKPCNCYMCSGDKYRTHRTKRNQEAHKNMSTFFEDMSR